MNYYDAIILKLGRDYDPINEIILQDDGKGIKIKKWLASIPEPTMAELDEIIRTKGTVFDKNQNLKQQIRTIEKDITTAIINPAISNFDQYRKGKIDEIIALKNQIVEIIL